MGKREDNKAQKRERLETEGLRLFLELGYDRCSIEQIAGAADVARGTFYLYFPDKLALFTALVERWLEPLLGVLDDVRAQLDLAQTPDECLAIYQQMGVALTVVALANPSEMLLTFRETRHSGESGALLRERELALIARVTALTQLAVDRGLIVVPDSRVASLVIMGGVERLFYEALVGGDVGDPARVAGNVVALFGRALALPVTG